MASNLTIIVPTFGRSTLDSVCRSIVLGMQPGDQFIVTTDGPVEGLADYLYTMYEGLVELVEGETRVGDFGCTPNDRAMKKATGDAIWFLGDDDEYPPGSLDVIRKAVEKQPDVVHVFSMMHTGRKLGRSINPCEVSSQQIVVPNRKDLPLWKEFPRGGELLSDFYWIDRVIKLVGKYTYHDEVICILHKQNFGTAL